MAGSVAEEVSVSHEEIEEDLRLLLAEGCSPSFAAKLLAKKLNLPRNTVYAIALKVKERHQNGNQTEQDDADV